MGLPFVSICNMLKVFKTQFLFRSLMTQSTLSMLGLAGGSHEYDSENEDDVEQAEDKKAPSVLKSMCGG